MSVNFTLRPVALSDAHMLHESCWPDRSYGAVVELIQRADGIARRGRGLGVVAVINLEAISYGQLTLWPRTGEISDLIVAEKWRSQGIGSAMVNYLIDQSRQWSLNQIEIGVAMSNPRALALYRTLGFKDDRLINLDLGSGPEAVTYLVMQLDRVASQG